MNPSKELARQFREVAFGGNWTSVDLKSCLEDVSWKMAYTNASNLNSIAALIHHMTYYFKPVRKVLEGGQLIASDKESWELPSFDMEDDWKKFKEDILKEAELFAQAIENYPGDKLEAPFMDEKYGNYFRNISGIIEHLHYHLGQITLLKKLISQRQ
jgi:uncharacterized damage-inducible protein DinB